MLVPWGKITHCDDPILLLQPPSMVTLLLTDCLLESIFLHSQIAYPDVFTLMEHVSRMGEGTASLNRQYNVGTDTFLAMAAIYQGTIHQFLLSMTWLGRIQKRKNMYENNMWLNPWHLNILIRTPHTCRVIWPGRRICNGHFSGIYMYSYFNVHIYIYFIHKCIYVCT